VAALVQDLGLRLVGGDVVRDLHRPDLATLVALADAKSPRDVRMRIGDGLRGGADLGVRVIALEAFGELVRAERGRGHEQERDQGDDRGAGSVDEGASEGRHAAMMRLVVAARTGDLGPSTTRRTSQRRS
jgi:hypothetical protein